MLRLLVVAVISTIVAACLVAGTGCPCGESFERDPFGSADLAIGPDHDESVHCFCRCGGDPRERFAPSETCDAYEGPCRMRNGEIAQYTCE